MGQVRSGQVRGGDDVRRSASHPSENVMWRLMVWGFYAVENAVTWGRCLPTDL